MFAYHYSTFQVSTPHTPSPSGSVIGPLEGGVKNGNAIELRAGMGTVASEVFNVETEKYNPSKEEVEENNKNLQHSASYLGELVFKLR